MESDSALSVSFFWPTFHDSLTVAEKSAVWPFLNMAILLEKMGSHSVRQILGFRSGILCGSGNFGEHVDTARR